MERVTFLLEETGERISAMLNPETVVMRRLAGIGTRRGSLGRVVGAQLADDPLIRTGGGRTELELELLFDVGLAGSTTVATDALALTEPFRALAENPEAADRQGRARTLRFVWGKSWNIPCVVLATAERFEQFTSAGAPRRAWMKLLLRRVNPPPRRAVAEENDPLGASPLAQSAREVLEAAEGLSPAELAEGAQVLEVAGDAEVGRLDLIAQAVYGNPFLWPLLALASSIADPFASDEARVVTAPSLERLRSRQRERGPDGTAPAAP